MSKLFICDNCKKEWNGPLDEVQHLAVNGVLESYDLCAACRKVLKEEKQKAERTFFDKIKKGK